MADDIEQLQQLLETHQGPQVGFAAYAEIYRRIANLYDQQGDAQLAEQAYWSARLFGDTAIDAAHLYRGSGRRGTITRRFPQAVDWITPAALRYFTRAKADVSSPIQKARYADILWEYTDGASQCHADRICNAVMAIDMYCESSGLYLSKGHEEAEREQSPRPADRYYAHAADAVVRAWQIACWLNDGDINLTAQWALFRVVERMTQSERYQEARDVIAAFLHAPPGTKKADWPYLIHMIDQNIQYLDDELMAGTNPTYCIRLQQKYLDLRLKAWLHKKRGDYL